MTLKHTYLKFLTHKLWIPLLIGFIFFLLRLTGLDWGFPAILHNDESNVVRSSLGMRFGDLNPHHFDWPSFYFYINYFFFWLFIKIRIQLQLLFGTETMQQMFPFWWGPELPFYLISRLLTNISIIISTIILYVISFKIIPSKLFAILTAVIFSIGFITFYNGFYGLSDATLTLFLLVVFYFCMKIIDQDKLKYYLLAGLFTGFATSIKYHGALGGILIFITHIYINRSGLKQVIFNYKIYLAGLIALIGFFITTPYSIIDYKTFFSTQEQVGAMWQIEHMGNAFNYHKHLFRFIPQNFGILLSFIGILGIYHLVKIKSKYSVLTLATIVLFVLYVGSWAIARDHYALIYFPYIAIIIGLGFMFLRSKFNNDLIWGLILAVCFIQPTMNVTHEIIKRNRIDTRVLSGMWIDENIPEKEVILLSQFKTGYFGGSMPIFDYEKYDVHEKEFKPLNSELNNISDEYSQEIITSNTINSINKYYFINRNQITSNTNKSFNCKNIYQIENTYRTGNEVYIFECNKINIE